MMHPVKSSAIAKVGHDGKALLVQFNSGETYRYPTASQRDLEAMLRAKSIGSHFAAHIQGKHASEKV